MTAPKIVFLLGAGASVDAGIPTSLGLAERFLAELGGKPASLLGRMLPSVVYWKKTLSFFGRRHMPWIDDAQLLREIGIKSDDIIPFDRGFKTPRASGRFETWRRDSTEPARHLNIEDVARVVFSLDEDEFVAYPLSDLTGDELKSLIKDNQPLVRELEVSLLRFLKRKLSPTQDVSYLAGLQHFLNPQPLPVFTMNYDLGVELACAEKGVSVCDGLPERNVIPRFCASQLSFSDSARIHLHKLHGSVNWFTCHAESLAIGATGIRAIDYEEHREMMRGPPTGVYAGSDWVFKDDEHQSEFYSEGAMQAMVFGTEQKMQSAVPYFDLFRKFAGCLEHADALVVIGYGFGDEYLNRLIAAAFNGFVEASPFHMIVVAPSLTAAASQRIARKLGLVFARETPRVHAVAQSARTALEGPTLRDILQKLS